MIYFGERVNKSTRMEKLSSLQLFEVFYEKVKAKQKTRKSNDHKQNYLPPTKSKVGYGRCYFTRIAVNLKKLRGAPPQLLDMSRACCLIYSGTNRTRFTLYIFTALQILTSPLENLGIYNIFIENFALVFNILFGVYQLQAIKLWKGQTQFFVSFHFNSVIHSCSSIRMIHIISTQSIGYDIRCCRAQYFFFKIYLYT